MGNETTCVDLNESLLARGIRDVTRWTTVQVAILLVYGVMMLMGLVGNGGVLFAVYKNRRLRSARNIFLLNLILTDILLCITAIPVTPWYGLTKEWHFGSLMCLLMPLSNSCSVFVTSWSLTAIAIDKFTHIMDPTRAPVTIKQAGLITLVIWIICSLINIPYLMSYDLIGEAYYIAKNITPPLCGLFCEEANWHGETPRRLYGSAVVLLQFVVPLMIITYCYSRILAKVAKDMIVQNAQFSKSLSGTQRMEAVNRKKKVNYILIGMVVAFIGCWLPLTSVNLVKDFGQEPGFLQSQPFLWPLIAHSIAMSTVIWNPLLFFWLTMKQKKPMLKRMITSSEAFTSLASRIGSGRYMSTFRTPKTSTDRTTQYKSSDDFTDGRSRPLLLPDGTGKKSRAVSLGSTPL